jgi:hypothetical protein
MKLRRLAAGFAAAMATLIAADSPPKITADPGAPPSDAIVLFDGSSLDAWRHDDGRTPAWKLQDGYVQVSPGTGDLVTVQPFGDCQLHLEWATPSPTKGTDQEPGNSGVYLISTYEIQILDSYENQTYPDGQAAAVYGQYPPMVNASRAPGEWQSYDIVFHGPRFGESGEMLRAGTVTVLHNGVLVQDHVTLASPQPHAEKLPLRLQDHGQPVRFRNVWIRELP